MFAYQLHISVVLLVIVVHLIMCQWSIQPPGDDIENRSPVSGSSPSGRALSKQQTYMVNAVKASPLCAQEDICEEGISNTIDAPNENSTTRCCKGCSCRADCEDMGTCCFPQRPKAHGVRRQHQCLVASSVQPSPQLVHGYSSYSMVTQDPNGGCSLADYNKTTTIQCGDMKQPPFGTMFPVYSKHTGLIYKNAVCASCHLATHTVTWTPILACKVKRGYFYLDNWESYLFNDDDGGYTGCQTIFVPPPDIADLLEQNTCILNAIRTCRPEANTELGYSFNYTFVNEACTQGIFAPYLAYPVNYYNVFCFMCNDRTWLKRTCQIVNSKSFENSILVILNYDFTATKTPDTPRMACSTKELTDCRETKCRIGWTDKGTGECLPVASRMSDALIYLQLMCVPANEISAERLMQHFQYRHDRQQPYIWDTWKVSALYMNASHNGSVVESMLMLVVGVYSSSTDFGSFLNTCYENITRGRVINLGAPDINVIAHMSPVRSPAILSFTLLTSRSRACADVQAQFKTYTTVYEARRTTEASWTVLAKVNMCSRVLLLPDDYELYCEGYVLYYKRTGRYFNDGEFHVDPRAGVSICQKDSGYTYTAHTSAANVMTSHWLALPAVVFCGYAVIQMLIYRI